MEWTAFSESQWAQIALYITGLTACWMAGLKIGVAVHKIRSLGKFL
jgi:hypothetical protein